mgnify:CR=1 FL=1
MATYKNVHTSLLRYCSDKAVNFNMLKGTNLEALNLDAISDESQLPSVNVIGIEKMTYQSEGDSQGLDNFTVSITIGTVQDENNMLLVDLIDSLFEELRSSKTVGIFDATSGLLIAKAVVYGQTFITPVMMGENDRVFQSIVISASVT